MPTGYTEGVQKGRITEFPEFALLCARAMGACVMLRDEPLSSDIPEFKPSTYYLEALEKAKREYDEWENMTEEQRFATYESECAKNIEMANKYIAQEQVEKSRYEAMLEQVHRFEPPTADHVGLKNFMIEQLTDSIKFDCGSDYWEEMKKAVSFEEWESTKHDELYSNIGRYAKEWEEEQTRTVSRNKWIKQLREALDNFYE